MARPSGQVIADFFLIRLMVGEAMRQLAGGRKKVNKVEAIKIVTPVWNKARLDGRISTSNWPPCLWRAVRAAEKQANVEGRGAYMEKYLKKIDRKPVVPWIPKSVRGRFYRLLKKDDVYGKRLRQMLTDPEDFERLIKRLFR